METIRFEQLSQFMRSGREIEFTFRGRHYSITTNGYWQLCLDEDSGSTLLERICPYKELDCLAEKTADILIDGITVRQIFDELFYDPSSLRLL